MDIFKKLKNLLGWNGIVGKRKGLSYRRLFKDGTIKAYFLEHRRQMAYYNQYVVQNADPNKISNNYWDRI